jgi:uncharacterized repeat protein (TIGR03803 family)
MATSIGRSAGLRIGRFRRTGGFALTVGLVATALSFLGAFNEPAQAQTGSLVVTLGPAAVLPYDPTWTVDGGNPFLSGGTASGLSVGTHLVSFSAVDGWYTPPDQTVTIADGQATFANATYVQIYTVLHTFTGGSNDGYYPYGSLTVIGSTVYGTTHQGGADDSGVVFKMNTDGTGFQILHSFAGGSTDGSYPYGSLTLSGETLYGTTSSGGPSDWGTVFAVKTDGTGFRLLRSFAGAPGDGGSPQGSLALVGTTLYGTTNYGGAGDIGTIFKINTDGTGYSLLHSLPFTGQNPDSWGSGTGCTPVVAGSVLYGMTFDQGSGLHGTVYSINTDGTGFTVLHEFTRDNGDGGYPGAGLTLIGTTLYGTTEWGGAHDRGTIFKINTDGTGYTILRSFADTTTDGGLPCGNLTLNGSTFYGTSDAGGAGTNKDGTLFQINTDGTGFTILHSFDQATEGFWPVDDVTLSGSTLYTMTSYAYPYGTAQGAIVRYVLPTPVAPGSLTVTLAPAAAVTAGAQWCVDGGAWQNSGDTVTGLSVGLHTLSLSVVSGWVTLPDETVGINTGATTSATVTYIQGYGSLKVTLSPAAAVSAGAKWNVDGGAWQNSGATLSGIPVGSHTVNYSGVAGWVTPDSSTTTINLNATTTLTAPPYVVQTGSLQVTLAPAEAILAGAKWNVDGGAWQDSGNTVASLVVGSHTVRYKAIAGWNSPPNAAVTITYNTTATPTGTYVQQTGSLKVTLLPAAAALAGAQWRVDGGAWHNSGVTLSGIVVGTHTVDCSQIAGWTSPASGTVTINNNQTTSVTKSYVTDLTPPALAGLDPASGAWNAPRRTLIALHVTDAGSGVDGATVTLEASRDSASWETIYSGAAATADPGGWTTYDASANTLFKGVACGCGTPADYSYVFAPARRCDFEERIYVRVNASDLAGNAMPATVYYFTIQARTYAPGVRVDGGTPGDDYAATAVSTDSQGQPTIWAVWDRADVSGFGHIYLASLAPGACQFSDEIEVAAASAGVNDRRKASITVTSDGTLWVAWDEGASDILVSSATVAARATWTTATAVNKPAGATLLRRPRLAVDSSDTLYLAMRGDFNGAGSSEIGVASLAGGQSSWTHSGQLSTETGYKYEPVISVGHDDRVYVAWFTTAGAIATPFLTPTTMTDIFGDIYAAAHTDQGWTASSVAVTNNGLSTTPAIAAEQESGALHFVWSQKVTTVSDPDIVYAKSAAGLPSSPLTGVTVRDGASHLAAAPRIAIDETRTPVKLFVAWDDRRSNVADDTDIMVVETKCDGSFGTNVDLTIESTNSIQMHPALGLAPHQFWDAEQGQAKTCMAPYLLWTDLRETNGAHIYFSEATDEVF